MYKAALKSRAYIGAFSAVLMSGCMSNGDGEELRNQLFTAQKRILELEERIEKSGEESRNSGSKAQKKIASTGIRLDQFDETIRSIQGEVDTLKRGVITGELPGMEAQPDSVAKAITGLEVRLEELEKAQIEILTLLKAKNSSKNKRKRPDLKNISDMKKAFEKKQYLYIVQDGNSIIASIKDSNVKNEAKFLFAESLFKLGRLRDAALKFNRLAAEAVMPEKGSHIAFRLGDCFRLLGDKKAAVVFYQDVVAKFPESEEAEAAREQLTKLQQNGS